LRYNLALKDGSIEGWKAAALTQAFTRRGVPFAIAIDAIARLQFSEPVVIDIELVFSREEFEDEMETQGIRAEWSGGEPREPFTLTLVPDHERWRGVWPKAVASALKTRGLPEVEADEIAVRLAAGEGIEDIVLRWVPSKDEELVIKHLEDYGVKVTKTAGG
jgi:hypothetical protein